jgi:hypothetical protein
VGVDAMGVIMYGILLYEDGNEEGDSLYALNKAYFDSELFEVDGEDYLTKYRPQTLVDFEGSGEDDVTDLDDYVADLSVSEKLKDWANGELDVEQVFYSDSNIYYLAVSNFGITSCDEVVDLDFNKVIPNLEEWEKKITNFLDKLGLNYKPDSIGLKLYNYLG